MAKQKIIAGHLDHKHGYYYMVLSLPNPEKGNRKLPKWFPTGIPYDGKRQTERDAKRMLKEWREDFTSGKLTLAMIEAKKRSKGTDGAMSLKSIPIRKDMYFTDYLLRWLEIIQADVEEDTFAGYWRTVHNPLLPYFSEHNATLEELSAVDLTLFYKYCKTRTYRGKPIKGNTIRHYHAVIHKALQDAVVVLRILQYNVADYVVAPKVDNYVAPYADTDELRELVNDLMCALPGFVDSKNEEKTERNAGYLVVSHSGGGMLRQGTREGIRRTPANRGMRAHRIVKGLDISEDVCHGMCP